MYDLIFIFMKIAAAMICWLLSGSSAPHGIRQGQSLLRCCQLVQVLLNSTLAQSTSGGQQPSVLNDTNLNFQTRSNAGSSYLTTQQSLGCDTCQNPAFLRGMDPSTHVVPVSLLCLCVNIDTPLVYPSDTISSGSRVCFFLR